MKTRSPQIDRSAQCDGERHVVGRLAHFLIGSRETLSQHYLSQAIVGTPNGTPACGDLDRHWRRSGGDSLPHLAQSQDVYRPPLTRRIVLMLIR